MHKHSVQMEERLVKCEALFATTAFYFMLIICISVNVLIADEAEMQSQITKKQGPSTGLACWSLQGLVEAFVHKDKCAVKSAELSVQLQYLKVNTSFDCFIKSTAKTLSFHYIWNFITVYATIENNFKHIHSYFYILKRNRFMKWNIRCKPHVEC